MKKKGFCKSSLKSSLLVSLQRAMVLDPPASFEENVERETDSHKDNSKLARSCETIKTSKVQNESTKRIRVDDSSDSLEPPKKKTTSLMRDTTKNILDD